MLNFIQSNKLETLFDRLCEILAVSSQDPLQPVEIVVQNPGMGRWVTQQLALQEGIAANLEFPLPARFIWQIIAGQLDIRDEEKLFDRSVLIWRILDELPEQLANPVFADIRSYLDNDQDGRKAYLLADCIADLFDQYLVYRPDMLLDWENSTAANTLQSAWQASLWKKLTESGSQHRARLFADFFAKCKEGSLDESLLPKQVYIFGISSLAPVYLQVISMVSKGADVYLFHLNPCQDLWDSISSTAENARRRKAVKQTGAPDAEQYFFTGNPLLASLGKVGREFLGQIFSLSVDTKFEERFEQPAGSSLLKSLQKDILELVDPLQPGTEKTRVEFDDRSMQFHSCHSRMREIQVLHDRLLDLFGSDQELKPGDILVMAPNIEQYAPAVRSVFNSTAVNMFIPWSLADRTVAGEEPLAASFLSLFELCTGRCNSAEVVSFLENTAVMRRFQVGEEDLATLRNWIDESGVRWGLDSDHRQEFGCMMSDEHSWHFGMNRLLMGYFVGSEQNLVHGIAAIGNQASSDAILLGRFASFLDRLRTIRKQLQGEKSVQHWTLLLLDFLEAFYDPGNNEEEQQGLYTLRETVLMLRDQCELAGYEALIGFPVIRAWLNQALAASDGGQGFLSGRVTFCNMVPMRSVPFKVICLLGMNDMDYPRQQVRIGFDLIGTKPRVGDRNRREDDRYLFLEAMISARDVLYISWIGHDQQDNSLKPASVVVADLIDYIRWGFTTPAKVSTNWPVTEHPLQPFSPKCFSGKLDTRSYGAQWLPVAPEKVKTIFIEEPLGQLPEEERLFVDLGQLVRFWSHPVRYFLEQRLELQVRDGEDILEENEPFQLDGLTRYTVESRIIDAFRQGQDLDQVYVRLKAEGALPHGQFGQNSFLELSEDIRELMIEIEPLIKQPLEAKHVELVAGSFHVTGRLDGLYTTGCIRFRPAKLKGRDLLKLWAEHLVYNGLGNNEQSIFVARDETVTFQPVDNPLRELEKLLELYAHGMTVPLHFYPETSRAWFTAKEEKKYTDAFTKWYGGFMGYAEGDDQAYRIALDGVDPLDEDFQHLAEEIYGPIYASLSDGE